MKKITDLVASVLEVKSEDLLDTTTFSDIDSWDSMIHMFLITRIEDEFEIELTNEEIVEMTTFAKIKKIVNNK